MTLSEYRLSALSHPIWCGTTDTTIVWPADQRMFRERLRYGRHSRTENTWSAASACRFSHSFAPLGARGAPLVLAFCAAAARFVELRSCRLESRTFCSNGQLARTARHNASSSEMSEVERLSGTPQSIASSDYFHRRTDRTRRTHGAQNESIGRIARPGHPRVLK
jgi:hypothetical protein